MNRILAAIILSLFVVTEYITCLVHERQNELQKLTRYTGSQSMSQVVPEYMRLESCLAGMAIGAEGAGHDEVRPRLEIMMSQIEPLRQGDLSKFINKSEQRKTVVATLTRNLHPFDKQVDIVTPEQIKQILPVLGELDGPLASIAAVTLTQDINVVNVAHGKIRHFYYIYSVISVLLIAMCITLNLLILRQDNNLRCTHVCMGTLTDDLQASKEKLQVQNRRLQYDAYHDSLTGMLNHLSFQQRLQKAVNRMRPYQGCTVMILFDLGSFRDMNDTLSHSAGDKLLQDLASRLSSFRKTSETLYRLGNDKFAMLPYDLTEEMALECASAIRGKISQPYQVYGTQINIDACIGIVISDGKGRTDYLYKYTGLALYEAEKEGSGHVQIFQPGMLQRLQENKSFEDDLLQALAHDEFKAYYQPITDTVAREVYGYEALVCWFHSVHGAVPSTVFIPVVEEIGLINIFGEWVLETACAEAASQAAPLKISVNISPIQLMNTSLTDTIIDVLQQTGLDPRRLDLEITEPGVFNENIRSLGILSQPHEQGIQVSIDDFGTGYSSLSRLSCLPFNRIRIDRSFVISVPRRKDDLDIVRLITSMGESPHMRIVAEGMEIEKQLTLLQALGCDLVQGYLIGRPSPLR